MVCDPPLSDGSPLFGASDGVEELLPPLELEPPPPPEDGGGDGLCELSPATPPKKLAYVIVLNIGIIIVSINNTAIIRLWITFILLIPF